MSEKHANDVRLIVGDLNIDLMRLHSGRLPMNYVTTMYSFGYTPLIVRPTRVTSHSATLIDHIWINDDYLVSDRGIVRSSITDHFPVYASLNKSQAVMSNLEICYKKEFIII